MSFYEHPPEPLTARQLDSLDYPVINYGDTTLVESIIASQSDCHRFGARGVLCGWGVPGSNLGLVTRYHEFPLLLQARAGIVH
jgi:hypothetical protein